MHKFVVIMCLSMSLFLLWLFGWYLVGVDGFRSDVIGEEEIVPLFSSRLHNVLFNDSVWVESDFVGERRDQVYSMVKYFYGSGEEIIGFHNGDIIDGIGPTFCSVEWEAAIRITPEELGAFEGYEVVAARFYHWENDSCVGSLKIYDAGTNTSPGVVVSVDPYNVTGDGWWRLNLTSPVPVDVMKDIWVSLLIIKQSPADYPMGIDSGPAVQGKGDWIGWEHSGWLELRDFGWNNNWGLEAILVSLNLTAYPGGPYEGLAGEEMVFHGGASGGQPPYSWLWDFGDGGISDQQHPVHTYASVGNYSVVLTVFDNESNVTSDTTWAMVYNPPPNKPNITGPHYGKPGVTYTFCIDCMVSPDEDPVYIYWEWGDGTGSGWLGPYGSGDQICASHAWEDEGHYQLLVRARNEWSHETISDPYSIVIDGTAPYGEILKPAKAVYINNLKILPRLFRLSLILGDVDIVINASDNLSGISKVEVFIDRKLRANLTEGPYIYPWKQSGLGLFFHLHSIKIVVHDHSANTAINRILVRRFF